MYVDSYLILSACESMLKRGKGEDVTDMIVSLDLWIIHWFCEKSELINKHVKSLNLMETVMSSDIKYFRGNPEPLKEVNLNTYISEYKKFLTHGPCSFHVIKTETDSEKITRLVEGPDPIEKWKLSKPMLLNFNIDNDETKFLKSTFWTRSNCKYTDQAIYFEMDPRDPNRIHKLRNQNDRITPINVIFQRTSPRDRFYITRIQNVNLFTIMSRIKFTVDGKYISVIKGANIMVYVKVESINAEQGVESIIRAFVNDPHEYEDIEVSLFAISVSLTSVLSSTVTPEAYELRKKEPTFKSQDKVTVVRDPENIEEVITYKFPGTVYPGKILIGNLFGSNIEHYLEQQQHI